VMRRMALLTTGRGTSPLGWEGGRLAILATSSMD
jgi:hypothetical protein